MYSKIVRRIAGGFLIILGVIGLFVPVLQGVLLIIAGLLLLGIKKEDIKKWFKRFK